MCEALGSIPSLEKKKKWKKKSAFLFPHQLTPCLHPSFVYSRGGKHLSAMENLLSHSKPFHVSRLPVDKEPCLWTFQTLSFANCCDTGPGSWLHWASTHPLYEEVVIVPSHGVVCVKLRQHGKLMVPSTVNTWKTVTIAVRPPPANSSQYKTPSES
jgi:hypothetical protein